MDMSNLYPYSFDDTDIWDYLRSTRWKPPGAADSSPERRSTYVFALEQAEQMLRAAVTVGPATRPLLIFYGLNQAGRAIAAAATRLGGSEWRLQGHGIHTIPGSLDRELPTIEVYSDRLGSKGSFVRLSELFESPLWEKNSPIPFAKLWDCLPKNRLAPIGDDDKSRRVPLYVVDGSITDDPHPLVSLPVVYFPPWVIDAADGYQAMVEYLTAYPAAQGYHSYHRQSSEPNAAPKFDRHTDGWGELMMNWDVLGGANVSAEQKLKFIKERARDHGGTLYFFPAIGSDDQGIHPLMAWWSVLYVLSMLARYQPSQWAEHIDVNHSRHAVPIEGLLKDAIESLPYLIAGAIGEASAE
jgi:hypothetical protein